MPLELYIRGGVYWVRGRAADGDEYIRKSLGTSDSEVAAAAVREAEAIARKRRILGPDAPKPEDEITFAACVLLYEASERDAGYLVPIVKRIGLWGEKVQRAYEDMGVLAFQDMEPVELFENDERIAADLEAQIEAMS